jgi:HK97 gp10 family phage protein
MIGGVKITGDKELAAAFRAIPDDMLPRVMAGAVRKLFKGAVGKAQSRLASSGRERTGALRRSIISKVKFYKRSRVLYAILGPDKDAAETYAGETIRPAKYSHFVELGTPRMVPTPYIKPSVEELGPDVVQALKDAFARAAKRAKKGGR